MSLHIRSSAIGLLSILGLVALAIFAAPDGQERADLAQFFGNFHPLAVHLPIALLLLVPILEIAGCSPQRAQLRVSAGFVLGLAAISAIVAPYLGWLLAWSGGFEGDFLTQHMWGGITVATGTLVCWILRGHSRMAAGPGTQQNARDRSAGVDERGSRRSAVPYVGMLTLTVLVVAFTGYRGGQLAHGEHHLTEHLPPVLKAWLGVVPVRGAAHTGPATFYSARIAPVLEEHCVVCHSANKRKGGLRLDSYEQMIRGGKNGVVITAGNAKGSDLFRRVSLDPSHKDFMPAEGKPPLSDEDRKLLQLWIDAGASATVAVNAVAGAPAMKVPEGPAAPDYRPEQQVLAQLESSLNIRLVPRSQNPTDGLILRTASFPAACDDAALAKLAPVARYIVDAELARTKVTDAGLNAMTGFVNLRSLDLSRTTVTSAGVKQLGKLPKLEVLNLTDTAIDSAGVAPLREHKSLKHLHVFQAKAAPQAN